MSDSIEKQMDKALKNNEHSKFIALFGQYNSKKNVVYYKTVALIYYLSIENFTKFYLLLQSCLDDYKSYEYVINVYRSIRICNIKQIEEQVKNADSSYRRMIEKIHENIKKVYEVTVNVNQQNAYKTEELGIQKDIKDCIHVIKEFKK